MDAAYLTTPFFLITALLAFAGVTIWLIRSYRAGRD